jgi:hypothetical protein
MDSMAKNRGFGKGIVLVKNTKKWFLGGRFSRFY